MTEFIDDLFSLPSPYGTPNLSQFAQLVNRETFWVVTEVVKETSINKRVNIIKRFIKVALQCKECRNFNSMFAIVSGLGHSAVSRLKNTWDKVSGKYGKIFRVSFLLLLLLCCGLSCETLSCLAVAIATAAY